MFDLVIVGAGPAGATLARLAPAHLRVLLVDRRHLGSSASNDPVAEKLCGGLLAPAAQRALAHQGLGVPREVLSGPQLFAVRTVDAIAGLERLYQRHYLNIDRDAFDRWLVSLVPDRVVTGFGWTFESIEERADGAIVSFRTTGGAVTRVRAGLVVGADGANSLVRRGTLGDRLAPARYIAVQGIFQSESAEAHFGTLFNALITDYYGWSIPKGATVHAGVALPAGTDANSRYDAFVRSAREAGFGLGTEVSRHAAAIARPVVPWQIRWGSGESVVLLGEAAGLISPSSAEGISYALRSAEALAESLESGTDGAVARYRRNGGPLAAEVVAKTVKARAIYTAQTRRLVMRSGIGAMGRAGGDRVGALVGELLAM
jgi:flavin-dependent dehydrogenase